MRKNSTSSPPGPKTKQQLRVSFTGFESSGTTFGAIVFYAFIAVLFFGAFRIVKNVSSKDHFIQ